MKRKLLYGIAIMLFLCVIVLLAMPRPSEKAESVPATPTPQRIMYFCGYDHCLQSGTYGEFLFPTDIKVWDNPDPDRGGIHHLVSHGDKAIIVEEKRIGDGGGRLWYRLEGGGWTNELWVTNEVCTPENLRHLSLDDC